MICIKFDQKMKKPKKNLNFGLSRFSKVFLKKPKNLGFFRSHFPALVLWLNDIIIIHCLKK